MGNQDALKFKIKVVLTSIDQKRFCYYITYYFIYIIITFITPKIHYKR